MLFLLIYNDVHVDQTYISATQVPGRKRMLNPKRGREVIIVSRVQITFIAIFLADRTNDAEDQA